MKLNNLLIVLLASIAPAQMTMDYTAIGLNRVPELLPVVDVNIDCDYCEISPIIDVIDHLSLLPYPLKQSPDSFYVGMQWYVNNGVDLSFAPGTTGVCILDETQNSCDPDPATPCKGFFTFDFDVEEGKSIRYTVTDEGGLVGNGVAVVSGPQMMFLESLCGNTHTYVVLLELLDKDLQYIESISLIIKMKCEPCFTL